jgi:hypothetical protein
VMHRGTTRLPPTAFYSHSYVRAADAYDLDCPVEPIQMLVAKGEFLALSRSDFLIYPMCSLIPSY